MNIITAKVRCTRCGGTQFLPQRAGQPRDNDTLTCASCGNNFKLDTGAIRKDAGKAVEKALADQLRRLGK